MNVDQFEKATNATKNSFQLLFLLAFAILLLFLAFSGGTRKRVAGYLDDLGIESSEVAGIKINRHIANAYKEVVTENGDLKRRLDALTSASKTTLGARDSPAPPKQANVLDLIGEDSPSWVYLGAFRNGRFLAKPNFEIKGVPSPGSEIRATTDTFKRSQKPYKFKDDWRLGDIKGVVKEGKTVRVIQTSEIEGDNGSVNLWAEVAPVKE